MISKYSGKIKYIIFFIMLALILIGYRSCNNIKDDRDALEVQISNLNHINDSLLALPPDTVSISTGLSKGDYINEFRQYKDSLLKLIVDSVSKARYDSIKNTYRLYNDSIVNDSIDIRFSITAKDLFDLKATYRPIYKYQNITIEKKVPYAVETIKEVKVYKGGLFFQIGLGFDKTNLSGKIGLLYLTPNRYIYGAEVFQHNGTSSYMGTFGVKF